MSFNMTAIWREARRAPSQVHFSGDVAVASRYLAGAGGSSGCGYPVALAGKAVSLLVYDGVNLRSVPGSVSLTPGDRIGIYAAYTAGTFTVTLYLNGAATTLLLTGCPVNTTLYATLLIQLKEG